MQNNKPNDVGYVLGNGPSRDRDRKYYDGVTYGCNSIYKEIDVDLLVCMDAWVQFEVIASGYPEEHECLFGSWNPIPMGVPPETLNPPPAIGLSVMVSTTRIVIDRTVTVLI